MKPAPRHTLTPRPAASIEAPALRERSRGRPRKFRPPAWKRICNAPSSISPERLLRLRTAPLLPAQRLDFLTQGSIVHDVLAQWWAERGDIEPLFERVFAETLAAERIPWVYHTERLRNAMLDDLRTFAANDAWQRGLYQSRMEESFELPLNGVLVRGKIDRLDVTADGRAYVIDYKYSNSQNTKGQR